MSALDGRESTRSSVRVGEMTIGIVECIADSLSLAHSLLSLDLFVAECRSLHVPNRSVAHVEASWISLWALRYETL